MELQNKMSLEDLHTNGGLLLYPFDFDIITVDSQGLIPPETPSPLYYGT